MKLMAFLLCWTLSWSLWGQSKLDPKDNNNLVRKIVFAENGLPKNAMWLHSKTSDNYLPYVVFHFPVGDNRDPGLPTLNFLSSENGRLPEGLVSEQLSSDFQWEWSIKLNNNQRVLQVILFPFKQDGYRTQRLLEFSISLDDAHEVETKKGTTRNSYADHSVLSSGTWYKIALAKDGMYKIDKTFLTNLGIETSNLNPQLINIYGNGGEMLSPKNSDFHADDLIKNTIFIQGEADGVFNSSDYIVFYGKGPDTWSLKYSASLGHERWQPSKHCYSDSAYYFIQINDPSGPSRINSSMEVTDPETHTVTSFQDFAFVENETVSLGKAGREFYGESFLSSTSLSYNFSFTNMLGQGVFEYVAACKSIGNPSSLQWNCEDASGTQGFSALSGTATSLYASSNGALQSFQSSGNAINVSFSFQPGNSDANAWIDFVSVNVSRTLTMSGAQMRFRDTTAIAPGAVALYQMENASSVTGIWDITDPLHPIQVTFQSNAGIATWKYDHSTLHEFIAYGTGSYSTPTPKGEVENQDLHGWNDVDLVVITAPMHRSYAEQLADIHRQEGQHVEVCTVNEVYNEFSSGNPDVSAIRMLMRMLYDRAGNDAALRPKNLLLFGDGAYNTNRGLSIQQGYNVIVYESDFSLSPLTSYVSDDYFVMLTDDDDQSSLGFLECGVGRIPASDAAEAVGYLNKVKAYLNLMTGLENGQTVNAFGPWRNVVTFVSDDQDGSGEAYEQVHMNSADSLARIMANLHPEYDIVKIYMDAYTQESTPGGERYPEVEQAIKNRIQNGSLLITYVGHGGERGWAHERVLDIPTIQNLTNLYRLPVFLTATCELARYDDPDYKSAGELLVMNAHGGAIAMMTTTRIVFSGENFEMDLAFYDHAFNNTDEELTLGKINLLTKNNVSISNDSKPNFSLLGDPALKLNYPKYQVQTLTINNQDFSVFTDTLKALEEVTITGQVVDLNGSLLSNFNGYIYPIVYDKSTAINTQNNDGGVVQHYNAYNKILFKGKASVQGGVFHYSFPMPYDINYSVGTGRITYYGTSGNEDAHGYNQSFLIGGSSNNTTLNQVGPLVHVFMNDTTFVNGGTTNEEPVMLVRLKDENGINTAGNGIGHDLSVILDAETSSPVILNEYFESDLNTYKSGTIRYPWSTLKVGEHTVTVKAWDTHNNSGQGDLRFLVAETAEMALNHVLNYPNPFTTNTQFMFEHNQPGVTLDVTIEVFSLSGYKVKTLSTQMMTTGFRSETISWDGLDDYGDRIGKGTYIYRVKLVDPSGKHVEKLEKLVLLR